MQQGVGFYGEKRTPLGAVARASSRGQRRVLTSAVTIRGDPRGPREGRTRWESSQMLCSCLASVEPGRIARSPPDAVRKTPRPRLALCELRSKTRKERLQPQTRPADPSAHARPTHAGLPRSPAAAAHWQAAPPPEPRCTRTHGRHHVQAPGRPRRMHRPSGNSGGLCGRLEHRRETSGQWS